MFKDIEEKLKTASDSQSIRPNDKLTEMIEQYEDDEISELELDLVSAAGNKAYSKFIEYKDSKYK